MKLVEKMNYLGELYQSYAEDRKEFMNREKHQFWLKEYMEINYRRYCPKETNGIRVLEIGSNDGTGYMWLEDLYSEMDYTGIDLSPEDVSRAKKRAGKDVFLVENAFDYLAHHQGEFDLIIMRAVLEHIQKDKVLELLGMIKDALIRGGVFLVDVPNMDWFLMGHERYMDFTHEVGFTPDSLSQVCNKIFGNVVIHYCETPRLFEKGSWWKKSLVNISRWLLGNFIVACEPDMNKSSIMSRDILGVVIKQ